MLQSMLQGICYRACRLLLLPDLATTIQERHCYRAWFSSDARSELGLPLFSSATAPEHGSCRIPAVSLDCQSLPCRRLLSRKMQMLTSQARPTATPSLPPDAQAIRRKRPMCAALLEPGVSLNSLNLSLNLSLKPSLKTSLNPR